MMKNIINGFFIENNKISATISEKDYLNAGLVLTALEAFAHLTYQSLYIIDYYNKNFLYVSENPLFLCGHSPDEVKEMGYNFYLEHIPAEEVEMLLEINRAGFDFITSLSFEEKIEHTISYDFHLLNEKRKTLVNHKMTPLLLTDDGSVWLAVSAVSLSSYKDAGHIEMRKKGATNYWCYSLERHKWQQVKVPILSNREKDILLLSARGYTMSEIADRLCMSINTVKFDKTNIFDRLKADSITEALAVASNFKML
jgi:DNA-binding CsgD family transcriptional regulator